LSSCITFAIDNSGALRNEANGNCWSCPATGRSDLQSVLSSGTVIGFPEKETALKLVLKFLKKPEAMSDKCGLMQNAVVPVVRS
jgi:hypothetical protein